MMIETLRSASPHLHTLDESLFNYAKELHYGDLHFKIDIETGLMAVIAIHSTKLGPALGGCRLKEYDSFDDAIRDALRLGQGMSYKAAVAGLALGGGKAVILKPKHIANRKAFFEKFGQFVEELGGRYITAVDSGTSPVDMDTIATQTKSVSSTSGNLGDPSPFTARGITNAIRAGIEFKHGKQNLDGFHIAIQGVGNVGYYLAQNLHALGARLTVTDVNADAAVRCANEFGATVVNPHEIYSVDCDVFSPCAMGAIINDETLKLLKAKIIIGGANNQLAETKHGEFLHKTDILYGPDYVVNAGGLIHAGSDFLKTPLEQVNQAVANIYDVTLDIFERSAKDNRPTSEVANSIAEEKLY